MSIAEIFTHPVEAGRELIDRLRRLQDEIPGFAIPPPSLPRWQRLGGYRTLPDRFFNALAFALETSAELRAVARVTAVEIRQMLRFSTALLHVAHELEHFARGIRHFAGSRRADVGRRAVSAYRIAQALNLVVPVDQPVPQAAAMKRAVTGRRRRNAGSPETDAVGLNPS